MHNAITPYQNPPTLVLQVHVTIQNNYCITLGLNPYYPKWMHTVTYVNHLMLVLNSSVNFIIYCLVGGK
jgi:hypothetical protein